MRKERTPLPGTVPTYWQMGQFAYSIGFVHRLFHRGRCHQLAVHYRQQSRCWIDGHFTEPNEQKTQQSPGFGRRSVLQLLHS